MTTQEKTKDANERRLHGVVGRRSKQKITPAMRRMIHDALHHSDPCYSLQGRSEHGGATRTLFALRRRGLLSRDNVPSLEAIAMLRDESPNKDSAT